MRVQHNIMAMNAYRNYTGNTSALSKNLEKLSSGYKINRAGDDAAGLAISEKMRAQISGLKQASSNAKSGINLVGTAEGSLTEVHDMLNRMVTLADQSANGTYDNETDRANLQKEVSQLKSEVNRIADSSNFNGIKLLDGTMGGRQVTTSGEAANAVKSIQVIGGGNGSPQSAISFSAASDASGKVTLTDSTAVAGVTWKAVGTDTVAGKDGGTVTFQAVVDRTNTTALAKDLDFYDGMSISVTLDSAKADGTYATDAATLSGITGSNGLTLQIGDTTNSYNQLTVSVGDMHTAALGIGDIDISTQSGAQGAVDKVKAAINSVSSTRGNLGALQNRLDHTINNLGVMTENIQDAESTVRDTDVAEEMMDYTKNNILVQSAQAMLAQANQAPQGVLQLLQ
ncbi:flagellin [Oscillibacter sp.]|uniref:flagellin N-terminal helical domain-containing protein n=1 Tax=Oscillibacter sp. TaxID=1945593 RepID=UPI0033989086